MKREKPAVSRAHRSHGSPTTRRGPILAVLLIAAATGIATDAAAPRRPSQSGQSRASTELVAELQPFAFLLGDWIAAPGAAGETGGFTFKSEVQGYVIVRTNYANYPAADGRPASRHDDLMVVSEERGAVHAAYYDNEGHVIQYVVTAPRTGEALFESEAHASEPRYRLRYVARDDGVLAGTFEVAPPDRPNAFTAYLSWTARRTR